MAEPFDFDDAWQQLVARAWADPALKAKLLADPAGALKAEGLNVPAGVTFRVVENTDKVVNLVMPLKPAPSELSEEELVGVTKGNCGVSNSTRGAGSATPGPTGPASSRAPPRRPRPRRTAAPRPRQCDRRRAVTVASLRTLYVSGGKVWDGFWAQPRRRAA